jgi:hypothetical protein
MVEIAIEDARVNLMPDKHMAIVKVVSYEHMLPDLHIVVFDFGFVFRWIRMKTDQRL